MAIVRKDTFTRSNVASGWGTATDGNTWTINSGDGDSVSSNEGVINGSSASTFATLGAALSTVDAEGLVRFETQDNTNTCGIILRWTDSSNHWLCRYDGATNVVEAMVKVSGTYTILSPTYSITLGQSNFYWLRFRCQGTTISFKVWQDGTTEPSSWTEQYTSQSSQEVAGKAGLYGFSNSGPDDFDNFSVDDLTSATHNLATDSQAKFDSRAVLAEGSRSNFYVAATLKDESQARFLSAAALKVEDRAQFLSRAALSAPSQSKFLIQAVLTQLLALGHSTFVSRTGLVSKAHSTFATRVPLATQLRDVFSTRFNLLAFARDTFVSRSALVSLAQDIFKIQVAPGVPGTGIGDISRSTGTQTANKTGNGYGTGDITGTESDYSYKDVTGSGWAVGANPWYGGMPISAWYELDPSLNTTLPQKTSLTGNQMTLLTTQSGGIVHWETESGGNYASSELATFANSGNFTELAPTNTGFRAYIKCIGDATDSNGIAWTAYACIYPGDPGFVVFRFDQHNPSGSAIALVESDVELIASLLTDAGQNPTGLWKRANGFIGTIGGSVTNGWPSGGNHQSGTFDFMGITPDTGNGVSLGTGAAVVADPSVQFSWTSGGYEANDTGTTTTPGRIKIGFYSLDPSTSWNIPAGQTNTYYVLRVFRRNLTSSDMAAIAADFKFPGTPSTTVGSFTTFSVDERAYTFSALANRLSATLDLTPANVTVRYKPIVKVTGWTSANAPVLFWGGVALTAGVDYRFYIDATNQVLYLQLYFDVVSAGAGTGQKNNGVLQVQAPNGLAAAVRTRYQIATGCGAVSRAKFSSAAALRAESRSSFASRTALVTTGRTLFFTRLNALVGNRTRFITLANLSQALRVKEFIGAALATHAQDTFKVNPTVVTQPFLRIVFAAKSALTAAFSAATNLRATFSVLPALSATFTRSVSVPTPNTTITVTATAFDINNNPVANCSAVTCTVTFPDGSTQAFAMPATITNAGAGKYTLTYKTKGPGPHTEDWDFVAADTVTTCEAHNTTPVSF